MQALRRARIPERYWTATPAQMKCDNRWIVQALAQPEAWAAQGWGFYIHGPFNTGKTAAAAILAMEFVRRCHSVCWLAVREVPQARFREGALGEALDLKLQSADFVVVDDLGAERFKLDGPAGAALEETARIVTERKRSINFTSNGGWANFAATYAAIPAFISVVQRHIIPMALLDSWPGAPDLRLQ